MVPGEGACALPGVLEDTAHTLDRQVEEDNSEEDIVGGHNVDPVEVDVVDNLAADHQEQEVHTFALLQDETEVVVDHMHFVVEIEVVLLVLAGDLRAVGSL